MSVDRLQAELHEYNPGRNSKVACGDMSLARYIKLNEHRFSNDTALILMGDHVR